MNPSIASKHIARPLALILALLVLHACTGRNEVDSGSDAASDAPATDAVSEAAMDSASDTAPTDAVSDTGSDTGPDVAIDTGNDAGTDAFLDVAVDSPLPDVMPNDAGLAARCTTSGGTIGTAQCCTSTGDFPSSCSTGACGCSPANSHTVMACTCPAGRCFDPAVGCR